MRTLPFGHGPTYTQVCAVRAELRIVRIPLLVDAALRALRDLEDGLDVGAVVRLNDASLEMAALDPRWSAFSVACFHAALSIGLPGAASAAGAIEAAFEACLAATRS